MQFNTYLVIWMAIFVPASACHSLCVCMHCTTLAVNTRLINPCVVLKVNDSTGFHWIWFNCMREIAFSFQILFLSFFFACFGHNCVHVRPCCCKVNDINLNADLNSINMDLLWSVCWQGFAISMWIMWNGTRPLFPNRDKCIITVKVQWAQIILICIYLTTTCGYMSILHRTHKHIHVC